ncbi:MAG: family 78 glycoside hydrolase catalytic domain [Armatimonadetes bacterium]|nr:family 78 glycoside hydrolase catalytic domain [Armatimonadota bacterium]
MKHRPTLLLIVSLLMSNIAHAVSVGQLRCEYRTDPLGVDIAAPRLSWTLDSGRQTAYQILADGLWDSGKVVSAASLNVRYAGRPLASSQRVTWRVRVWDEDDKPSAYSAPASFVMGLLADGDWQAQWIGSAAAAGARRARGYHAAEAGREDDVKWVQIDLGQARPLTTIRLHPMRHEGRDGFGFPLRYRVEIASDAAFATPTVVADQTAADVANPGVTPVAIDARGASARYVRVTATKLAKPTASFCFALSQIEVVSDGRNVAQGAAVTAKDTVELYGWGKDSLTDGTLRPGVGEQAASGSVMLRREITVRTGLRRALVHLCGLGEYELSLNDAKVGSDLFAPGWSKYDRTCLYETHDLTAALRPGANELRLLLGNGMYNVVGGRYTKFTGSFGPPKAIAHLRLEYADGTTDTVGTDDRWQASPGPLTFTCVYGGEDYDARWTPTWEPAAVVQGPGGALRGLSVSAPPVRAFEVLKPANIKELRPNVKVYDLGQNVALMPRLTARGPAGSTVRITPSELLRADGDLDDVACGGGGYWTYTLAGRGAESWAPAFYYRGARYLRVHCAGGAEVTALDGVVVHSSSTPVGGFECSNDLFNRIHTLVRWAQRSNMVSVLTDCPHREKLGWLEQYHLNGPSLRYEFDLAALFAKGMNDMADGQLANGLVPTIAPEYVKFGGDNRNAFGDSPEWGSAFVLVPWQQVEFDGDLDLLRARYDAMGRYVAYLGSRAREHIVDYGLGDWYDIGPRGPGESQLTPKALTATAIWYEDITVMLRAARLLGKIDDVARYEALAKAVGEAFNARFFNAGTGSYATGSQTANAMPLVLGLVSPERRAGVVDALVRDVQTKGLTAGDVGYRYLLRALADNGRSDVVFAMNNQSDKPGYGYQLKRGATSLTEAWDAGRGSSQNHFMLGQINEWFYHDLAGIQCDPAGPGFARIVIRPAIVGDLSWVKAHHDSPYGRIESSWRREGAAVTLEVTIPGNTTATVFVPGQAAGQTVGPGQHRFSGQAPG